MFKYESGQLPDVLNMFFVKNRSVHIVCPVVLYELYCTYYHFLSFFHFMLFTLSCLLFSLVSKDSFPYSIHRICMYMYVYIYICIYIIYISSNFCHDHVYIFNTVIFL